mgnify:CR=1 FL=1
MSEEQKFPLTKKAKAEFVKNYELIFLKVPPHNISDEKLVELVNSNQEKLSGNVTTNEQPSQEGIQNEGGEGKGNENGESQKRDGANGENQLTPEQIEAEKQDLIETEKKYIEVFGRSPLIDYSVEKMKSEIETELERKAKADELSKRYFALFGKTPLSDMTEKQIVSAIENEEKRQGSVKTKSVEKVVFVDELEHDEKTQMVIQRKKDPTDKRVINKTTFPYLKHDFEEVVKVPKEIQNKK